MNAAWAATSPSGTVKTRGGRIGRRTPATTGAAPAAGAAAAKPDAKAPEGKDSVTNTDAVNNLANTGTPASGAPSVDPNAAIEGAKAGK